MNPLQVVLLSDFANINGGSAAVALTSAEALARRGHAVTLLSAVGTAAPFVQTEQVRFTSTNQQEILKEPSRLRAILQGIWNIKAAHALESLLDRLDPATTIIHVHSWTQALSSSVIHVALTRRFKVVCTLHDYFAVCPNGTFFHHPENRICHLRPMSASCIASQCDKRNYLHKLWRVVRQDVQARWGGMPTRIQHFIVVSEFSRSIVEPYLPSASRIYHVSNPVHVDPGGPVPVDRNRTFVMLGQVSHGKGPHLFANAARALGCEALFIGDGPCAWDIVQLYGAARITGWVSREKVMEYLRSARVLVFPSLWYETEGLSVLEAAAMGVPAVVADTSAARFSVEDGVTGLCFAGGNEEDLTRKMASMLDNELAGRMGRSAYAQYWKHPRTLDRHAVELEAVYEQILAV
jgi:glycosyltransferase involved in cell wall biosynthesis